MTDITTAEPGDIYTDASGKLWRILSVVREPTVEAEEVEGTLVDPNRPSELAPNTVGSALVQNTEAPYIHRRTKRADALNSRWNGWTRIWRHT